MVNDDYVSVITGPSHDLIQVLKLMVRCHNADDIELSFGGVMLEFAYPLHKSFC